MRPRGESISSPHRTGRSGTSAGRSRSARTCRSASRWRVDRMERGARRSGLFFRVGYSDRPSSGVQNSRRVERPLHARSPACRRAELSPRSTCCLSARAARSTNMSGDVGHVAAIARASRPPCDSLPSMRTRPAPTTARPVSSIPAARSAPISSTRRAAAAEPRAASGRTVVSRRASGTRRRTRQAAPRRRPQGRSTRPRSVRAWRGLRPGRVATWRRSARAGVRRRDRAQLARAPPARPARAGCRPATRRRRSPRHRRRRRRACSRPGLRRAA